MKTMLMCLGLVLGIAGHFAAATYYVDVAGNDQNSGSVTQPFATLRAAYLACVRATRSIFAAAATIGCRCGPIRD